MAQQLSGSSARFSPCESVFFPIPSLFSGMHNWECRNCPSLFSWRAVVLVVVLLCSCGKGRKKKNCPSKANEKARKNNEAVWRRDLTRRWNTGAVVVKTVFLICTDGLPAMLLNAMKTVVNACYSNVWLQNRYPTLLTLKLCLSG